MAQLIKLEDYVSRYERNIHRYPSQFIRMKRDNWKKMLRLWQNDEMVENTPESTSVSLWSKGGGIPGYGRRQATVKKLRKGHSMPETEYDLKHYFLDQLFPMQLQWASSTIMDVSFIKQAYHEDGWLKTFLQRFSDAYLLMYYPVFAIRQASVEGEIIFISPTGIDIIHLIDKAIGATIWCADERVWTVRHPSGQETTMLSPLLALKRTEQIVKAVFNRANISLPVTKVVLAPASNLVFPNEPYHTKLIGRQDYDKWFRNKRRIVSPLKNQQLKAAGLLLSACRTMSVKRPEWQSHDDACRNDSETK